MAFPTTTEIYYKIGLALKADEVPSDVIFEDNINAQIADAKKWFKAMKGYQLTETTVKEKLWGTDCDYIFCKYYPFPTQGGSETDAAYVARVITSLVIDGTVITINSTNLDVDSDTGKIILKSDGSPEVSGFTKTKNYATVKITHLYQDETLPEYEFAVSLMASILAMAAFIGSTYDDVTGWSKADLSAQKGEPYTNLRASAFELRQILDELMANIPYKMITE